MSEEQQPAVPAPRKSSFMSTLIWVGVAVMVAAIAAVVLYLFLLRPMLAQDTAPPAEMLVSARQTSAALAAGVLNTGHSPNILLKGFEIELG